jgi:NAD(P)-dependent dehydrogenase (short-subunit alcohol dehydrogenase family)
VTVKYLVSKGARVSIGDIDESKFESIMAHFQLEGRGEQVRVYKVDVGDSQSVNDWMHNTVEWAGQLDGAANIAGMSGPDLGKPLAETSDQHWDLVLRVNLTVLRA